MSAPKRAMRDARDIANGFLAAKAAVALRNASSGQLSADDRAALSRAADLLDQIVTGTQRTKGEVVHGVRPSRSIAALNLALGPIDTLKKLVKTDQEGLSPFFQRLAHAVRAVEQDADLSGLEASLSDAREFFDGVSGWHASALASRRRTGSRDRTRPL
jgi:hypothetical protein